MASSSDHKNNCEIQSNDFVDPLQCITKKEWVKFDEENVHITPKEQNISLPDNQNKTPDSQSKSMTEESSPAIIEIIPTKNVSQLSTVELPPSRKNEQVGFGKIK